MLARHTAVYLIKQYWKAITYKKMGSYFGNKDHSTMMHSLKQYDLEVERGCINLYSVTNIIAKFEDEQEEKVAA